MNNTFCKRLIALSVLTLFIFLTGCGKKENTADGTTDEYMPPVNDEGYIVITMPKTLLGGKTAEELEAADKEERSAMEDDDMSKRTYYSALTANEDGTFSYYLTPEQFLRFK